MSLHLDPVAATIRTTYGHSNIMGPSSALIRRVAELLQREPGLLLEPERLAVLLEQERRSASMPLHVLEAWPVEGPLGGGDVLVVVVERERSDIPSEEEICRRFGLTRRESTVAWCLAHRHSNEEIAHALRVSPHTARHHTERVLAKLGVHTRRAVRAALVAPPAAEPAAEPVDADSPPND